jgi:hypothetical protein
LSIPFAFSAYFDVSVYEAAVTAPQARTAALAADRCFHLDETAARAGDGTGPARTGPLVGAGLVGLGASTAGRTERQLGSAAEAGAYRSLVSGDLVVEAMKGDEDRGLAAHR